MGFSPTPSGRTTKNTIAIAQIRSQERDAKVTQLKNQMTILKEKMSYFDNFEEWMTQMASMMQLMQNHSSKASRVLNFNVLRMYLVFTFF